MTAADPTTPPRRRTAVEQLILDLAVMWTDRYLRAQHTRRGDALDPADLTDQLWRAQAAGITDGWAVLYLLALLRTHSPQVAEHAAHTLNGSTADAHLATFVQEWARAVDEGRSLLGLLP